MLPDLPELKAELREIFLRYVSRRAHAQLGAFSEAPRHVMHEGTSTRVDRENGEAEDSDMMRASVEVLIDAETANFLTRDDRKRILDELADQMAREMSGKLFAALHKSLARAGQIVDNSGQSFDAEAILRALERIEFEFDEGGNPRMPAVQLGPDMQDDFALAMHQLESDPHLAQRLAQLLGEKKGNWRDREASRKLVG